MIKDILYKSATPMKMHIAFKAGFIIQLNSPKGEFYSIPNPQSLPLSVAGKPSFIHLVGLASFK